MPHVAQFPELASAEPWQGDLSANVQATVLKPRNPNGMVALSFHGGPGWFGDGLSHEHLWMPLFGAIAAQSGVTIVDVRYPLPGYGSWEGTRRAVSQLWETIRDRGEYDRYGVIAFGSGLLAAQDICEDATFILAMSPRLPERIVAMQGKKVLFSTAKYDTRGISGEEAYAYFQSCGALLDWEEYESEHLIAAPKVWRERVEDSARWLLRLC